MNDVSPRIAATQIIGSRERQEDDYGVLQLDAAGDAVLLIVADGMGGHAGGAEAAQAAVHRFLEVAQTGEGLLAERLAVSLDAANVAVGELTQSRPELDGAGCTLVAAAIADGTLTWVSVGDSSLLLHRDGTLTRLNADHSMRPVLEEMVRAGRMEAADAETNSNRNALRSAITGEAIALIDRSAAFTLEPHDELLLVSDGVDVLDYRVLVELLNQHRDEPAADAADAIMDRIKAVGHPRQDNATVVLYRASQYLGIRRKPRRGARMWVASAAILTSVAFAFWLFATGPSHVTASALALWHSISATSGTPRSALHVKLAPKSEPHKNLLKGGI